MSGIKITELPASTTPLSGSEIVPLVQGGVTKRATVTQIGTVTATGTTAARTLPDRFAETISVKDFGAVGDGVADDTTAIQAAISAVASAGGGTVFIPPGSFKISSTLSITRANILLSGAGGDISHDVGTNGGSASTTILWAGVAGGTMVRFASPTGASAQKQSGGGLTNVFLQCAGSAAVGLEIYSWNSGVFQNIGVVNPTLAGIDMGVVSTLGEARDPQNNYLAQISIRCLEDGGTSANGLRLSGDATANTSLNLFEQIDVIYLNGAAYLLRNSDNNLFIRCRAFRAATGTGASAAFLGSNISLAETARTNIFFHFSSNAAAIARGTTSYTYASYNNSMLMLDQDNATPAPTVETGATLHYTRTDNIDVLPGIAQAALGSTVAEVDLAKQRIVSTETLHVYNGSSDHVRLDDGTNLWGASIASGNLRFARLSGSGRYQLTPAAVNDYADDTAAAAGGVPLGGLYRTGSAMKIRVT